MVLLVSSGFPAWTHCATEWGGNGTWIEVVFGHIKILQGYAGARKASLSGDDVTAIDQVQTQDADEQWYDLRGRKIERPTVKGLYILNGKKVVVK